MKRTTKSSSIRENFLRLRGGKLISIESYVLGFVVLFVVNIVKNYSMPVSCIVALIVGFVFPILIGLFKSLAWIAAVAFSLIWGVLAYGIVGAIAHNSVILGLLGGIIVFAISFVIHKNYSGLVFQGVSRNDNNQQQAQITTDETTYEAVAFCPKCGRRIHSIDGRCDFCGR